MHARKSEIYKKCRYWSQPVSNEYYWKVDLFGVCFVFPWEGKTTSEILLIYLPISYIKSQSVLALGLTSGVGSTWSWDHEWILDLEASSSA